MGADDSTRARAAIDAVIEKHRDMSAAVGAAATWAAAAAIRSQQKADDVAWSRATAYLTGDMSACAWSYELRDYEPIVVWSEYAERLTELHDDLGTALLGPVIYRSVAALAPANAPRTVKHIIELTWREHRASRVFEGRLPEAAQIHQELRQRHDEWVCEVDCAADVLEQTGFTSLWMRSTYSASTTDRLKRAVRVFHDVYAAAAWAQNEPHVLMEWTRRDIPLPNNSLAKHLLPTQADVRRAIASRVAFIIDRWIAALIAGGLSDQERDVTVLALENKYPEAVAGWRRMCASRVSSGLPAVPVPSALYGGRPKRRAS
jgi:hypothetical protein